MDTQKWQIIFTSGNDIVDSCYAVYDMPIPRVGESVLFEKEEYEVKKIVYDYEAEMPTIFITVQKFDTIQW